MLDLAVWFSHALKHFLFRGLVFLYGERVTTFGCTEQLPFSFLYFENLSRVALSEREMLKSLSDVCV
jgi:hypothetical protein